MPNTHQCATDMVAGVPGCAKLRPALGDGSCCCARWGRGLASQGGRPFAAAGASAQATSLSVEGPAFTWEGSWTRTVSNLGRACSGQTPAAAAHGHPQARGAAVRVTALMHFRWHGEGASIMYPPAASRPGDAAPGVHASACRVPCRQQKARGIERIRGTDSQACVIPASEEIYKRRLRRAHQVSVKRAHDQSSTGRTSALCKDGVGRCAYTNL